MSEIIRFMLISSIVVTTMLLTLEISQYTQDSAFLKEDIEMALHDAIVHPDSIQTNRLADGYIVFDESHAKQVFRNTFERNTGIVLEDEQIVEFTIIDDDTIGGLDPIDGQFPLEYNSPYVTSYQSTFIQPSIFAVIKLEKDSLFYDNPKPITRYASYTYRY